MITIQKNPSFTGWFQVISFGRLVDEVSGRAKALRLAKQEAKENKINHIMFLDKIIDINE
tara:strand:+ start:1185 stop:1364 length:180 start_codon:yes stop_codon:yes gene_type:complete